MDKMDRKTIELVDQTEYTFQLFNSKIINKQKSEQSLFNCSTFKKCLILCSNFSKCDFEGSIFQDTVFKDSHISSCDIKSGFFRNCTFTHCDFSLSAVSDCEFTNCGFYECNFDDAVLRENTFYDCVVDAGSHKMATVILSRYYHCSFRNAEMGNCSFYDHIMDNCRFEKVTINIDSIGRIFGLTIADLRSFQYIFLGKLYGYAPETFFEHVQEIFGRKNWQLQKFLYQYNVNEISSYEYIDNIFETLTYYTNENIIVKRDDLTFLSNIIGQMKEKQQLPLFALYTGIEKLFENIRVLDEKTCYNKKETFREFLNKMVFNFNELLAEFAGLFPSKVETNVLNEKVLLRIHYDSDKEIDFTKYINSFLKYGGYDNTFYCRLSDIQHGTLIEIIVGSILAVYALQILLYGVNGIIIQLIDMISKVRVIKEKENQKDFLLNSIKGKQMQPELLVKTVELLKNKEFNDNMKSLASILSGAKIIDISAIPAEEDKPQS